MSGPDSATESEDSGTFREVKPGSFIYEYKQALDSWICREMIRRFEANPGQQVQGRIGQDASLEESIKRSTDLRISGREDWRDIDEVLKHSLTQGLSAVSGLHPFFGANRFHDIGYNLQKTEIGDFYHWHIDAGPGQFAKRQLVAIWYLNDCSGPGGETEFYFQNVSVRPEEGTLVLFPPFWTHLHRGRTLESGIKYIATTWICCE
ncbi:MAG: 2OG-Fe(II) oxygenase [Gammaproteobacteria bacterium]|nr:2OG-Fe(II) oxygenase [Gammaproteobacteria bacterium]MCY4228123.1 2OG-Fe(II) oxygenase [Gammaproteobacteria bacterium]MCY4312328.1 2OG-Fe(II) oxygenase [Gammaproteobacteria bacterium]